MTKYDFEVEDSVFKTNINRLTNQIWKLIPMREKEEDWELQLNTVICELTGLHSIFNIDENFLVLLSKLEGIKTIDTEFEFYRKTIFESITLLRGLQPWLTVQT